MLKAITLRVSLLTGLILLFAGAFVVPSVGLANITDGLVGYWSFDEGGGTIANDYSGNNNNGTVYGSPNWVTGISGSALQLDGINDYVAVPNSASLNPPNAITLAAWYKPVSFPGSGNDPVIDKAYISHTYPWYQYHLGVTGDQYSQDQAEFGCDVTTDGVVHGARTPLNFWTPGTWYFLTGTYDGSALKFYVDGELIDEEPASGTMTDYGKPVHFGKQVNSNNYLPGTIDEVRIYNIALSDAEICQLYNTFGPWDQEKLFFDPAQQSYTLFYTDGDLDGWHDPGEPYFTGPDPSANDWNFDYSCWMASATNILQHECRGNSYRDWLRDGGAPSPSTSPWGVVINAEGGGDHMTFDDGGWQHWALDDAGCIFSGPITTTTESGTWSINPINWCRNRLASDYLIGITIYWGKLPPDALPGWIDPTKQGGYHAITLWDIDPAAGTLTITDSDDQFDGQLVLLYTFTNNDWVIQNWVPGHNAHINYAVSSRSEGDGDVNNDGVTNSADITYLINFLFVNGPAPQPLVAGDANCDGNINSADVAYLINYLFVSGPPPGC